MPGPSVRDSVLSTVSNLYFFFFSFFVFLFSSLLNFPGKSTPVSQLGSADFPEAPDPFQPLGADSSDPFQNKKGFGDPFSGKDPFAPSSSAKPSKASSLGFADFTSFGNEEQQLAWAKRESEKAEQERLARLRRQEQEDLELAIALSKADMPAA